MTPTVTEAAGCFTVHLAVFEGPFDLLLALIGRHKLDVTEVALSEVTDEFLAHTRALGDGWDLGQTTEFLVVAATLLDLKVARLLPSAAPVDEEDLALLEARDLLFARLLQYRAYKEAAALLAGLLLAEQRHLPRYVGLEGWAAAALPEVDLGVDADAFAVLAARALAPREEVRVAVDHAHVARVDMAEQRELLLARLHGGTTRTFRRLVADCRVLAEVVARFLGLLDLYREGRVLFDQLEPLGELQVRLGPGLPVVLPAGAP